MDTPIPTQPRERVVFLDYVRALACFMVIFVHSNEFHYFVDPPFSTVGSAERAWVSLYGGVFRYCVPLFIVTSAYLLVPLRQSAGEFFRRRITRVFVPAAVWALLYATLPLLWGDFSLADVGKQLGRLPFTFPENGAHLWFIYMLLGVYMVMPIVSPWIERASRRELRFYIGLWTISTFAHYALYFAPDGQLMGYCLWNEFNAFFYVSGFIGYVILAYYIRRYVDWSWRKTLTVAIPLLIVGTAITCGGFYWITIHSDDLYLRELTWRYCTPNVAMATAGIFLLFKKIPQHGGRLYAIVKDFSVLSYGIYLVHLMILTPIHSSIAPHFPTAITVPLTSIACFLAAYLIVKAISYLPHSKYVVG